MERHSDYLAKDHPDLKAFDEQREKELARIGGIIVGDVQHANIVTVGHPRLMGQLRFTDTGEMSQHILNGKLSLSTGFWCHTDRRSSTRTLVGDVKPNHVLVFVEDLKNQPKDQGSVILNKEERKFCHANEEAASLIKEAGEIVEETEQDAITNVGKVISQKNCSRLQKIISKLKEVFGSHNEAIKDMEGLFSDMVGGRSDVNGDYQSVLPPTGATDQPELAAAGKESVGNDRLRDAITYPATGGMRAETSMKQKAETAGTTVGDAMTTEKPELAEQTQKSMKDLTPFKKAFNKDGDPGSETAAPTETPEEETEDEDEMMNADMKGALEKMGFKYENGAAFLTQLKQMLADKKALEERVNKSDAELAEFKKGKENAEEELEEKKQKIATMQFDEFKNKLPKGMYPKTPEAETQLRKDWDADPVSVTNKVMDSARGLKPGTKEEGVTNTATEQKLAAIEEIKNKKTRGIGTIKFAADGSRVWED
jgi:flagellar biosynthesis chaperone FliJ